MWPPNPEMIRIVNPQTANIERISLLYEILFWTISKQIIIDYNNNMRYDYQDLILIFSLIHVESNLDIERITLSTSHLILISSTDWIISSNIENTGMDWGIPCVSWVDLTFHVDHWSWILLLLLLLNYNMMWFSIGGQLIFL